MLNIFVKPVVLFLIMGLFCSFKSYSQQGVSVDSVQYSELDKGVYELSWAPADAEFEDYYVYVTSHYHLKGNVYKRIQMEPGQNSVIIDFNEGYYQEYELHRVSVYGGLYGADEDVDGDYHIKQYVFSHYTLQAPDSLSFLLNGGFEDISPANYYLKLNWKTVSTNLNAFEVSFKRSGEQVFVPFDTSYSYFSARISLPSEFVYSDWEVRIKNLRIEKNGKVWESAPLYGTYEGMILGSTSAKGKEVYVYPNPSQNQLHISTFFQNGHYTLFDLQGGVVLKGELKHDKTSLDVSGLLRGVYMLQIDHEEKSYWQKVVISK